MTITYAAASSVTRAAKALLNKAGLAKEDARVDVAQIVDGFVGTITVVEGWTGSEAMEILLAQDKLNIIDEGAPAATKRKDGYIHEVSDHGGVCSEVWAICDELQADCEESGEKLRRRDVIEACREAGIAYGTARTQYQRWKNRNK